MIYALRHAYWRKLYSLTGDLPSAARTFHRSDIFAVDAIEHDFSRSAVDFRFVVAFGHYGELTIAALVAFVGLGIPELAHKVCKEAFEHLGRKRTGGHVTICTAQVRRLGAQYAAICQRVALCIACVCMFSLGFLLVLFLLAKQLLQVGKVKAALFVAFRLRQFAKAFR